MPGTSDDPDNLCVGDRLVYTCTSTDGILSWDIGGMNVGTFVGSSSTVGDTRRPAALPGVVAMFTAEDINGVVITSTLTIPSAGIVVANGSNIICTGFVGNTNSTVLHIIGEWFVTVLLDDLAPDTMYMTISKS